MLDTQRRRGPTARGRSRWAHRIACTYSLTLPEARAELRRLAAHGWQAWEFHTRFTNARKDDTE